MQIFTIAPGVTLRHFSDTRFKQGCMSVQLVRPMCREEAAKNALLSAVLLRGSENYPDLQTITWRLDELYGASVGTLVRRVGDYQTTGLYCSLLDDRFALPRDRILEPTVGLLQELLLRPKLEKGIFSSDYVESEKRNLVLAIEAQRNDKRAWCNSQLIKNMCREDSFGLPRLGEIEDVKAITPQSLYDHYRRILKESRMEIFYVGSASWEQVKALWEKALSGMEREYIPLGEQTPFTGKAGGAWEEAMDIAQGKLAMGFVTPANIRQGKAFVATQMMNLILGGGMTSKLFTQVREKMSLCYAISSGYHGSKGILTVNAGMDWEKKDTVRQQVLAQLEAIAQGDITSDELAAARQAMLSSLRATHDSPGSIENYYATAALSGLPYTPEGYMQAVEEITAQDVAQAAGQVTLHSESFLKGEQA